MTSLTLRPRSFSELIDATFVLVRARFSALATVGALMMLPGMILSLVVLAILPASVREATSRGGAAAAMFADGMPGWAIGALIAATLVGMVMYTVGFGALVTLASNAYLGRATDVAQALSRGAAQGWTLFFAALQKYLLVFVLIFIGGAVGTGFGIVAPVALVVIVPAIIVGAGMLFTMWSLTTPVVMLEETTSGDALSRSAVLTKGRRLRLLGMYAVMGILVYILLIVAVFSVGLVVRNAIAAQMISNVVSIVLYPLVAVLVTVVYYDLRIRSEGFDLEVMASGLPGGSLPPASAGTRQPA